MNRRIMALLLTCMLALGAALPGALAETIMLPDSYTALNLRSGPGTNYAVTGWALPDDAIDIIKWGDRWTKVELVKNGKSGYVKNTFIAGAPSGGGSDTPAITGDYDMGVVTGRSVNMRKGPATSYALVKSLSRNTRLKLHGVSGNWYYAQTTGGVKGYISKTYVKIGAPYTTTARVNMRVSPNGALIKTLTAGKTVTCLQVSGTWSYVSSGSSKGWVFSRYLK